MKKRIYPVLLAVLTTVILSGKTVPAQRETTIVAFGDSITAPRENVVTYSDLIREEFKRKNVPAKVINAGIGGNTTVHAKARFEKDVLAYKPELVIIQFGTNDAAVDVWKNPPATASRVPLAVYEQNLRFFITELKARGAKIILVAPTPQRWTDKLKAMYGKPPYDPDDPNGFNIILKSYVERVRKLARREKVPLVDMFSAFIKYQKGKRRTMDELFLDGLHPNSRGQDIEADLLLREIRKMKLGL